jgi:hypothetical protein
MWNLALSSHDFNELDFIIYFVKSFINECASIDDFGKIKWNSVRKIAL